MTKFYSDLILVFATIIITTTNVNAQTPKNVKEIPIYPGAKLVNEETVEKSENIISGIRRHYVVAEASEKVVAFYEKALNTKKRFEDPDDQDLLNVGKTTQPPIQVYDWDDTRFVDGEYGEGGSSKRAWIKNELLKREKDKINKAWIENANSEWYYRGNESTMTSLHLMIDDKSIDEEHHKYELKTEITIEVTSFSYER
jgi:hypothetical protein